LAQSRSCSECRYSTSL